MMHNKKIIKYEVKKILSNSRYKHALKVAEYAKALSKIYGLESNKAYIAGLIHDIAKEFSKTKIVALSKKNKEFKKYPSIKSLHGIASAHYAKNKLDINDTEILDAVSNHVISKKNVSMLSMILFIADKLESSKITNVEKYKILAENNIRKCFLLLYKNFKR
ncbi:MAG: bis(5'-nucleosyl)-tetraphosphatase (symmetrical) YqeK [Mycoplasmataceae bacterium]|jgi:nicotinate-nucleotide adenylyltransferase|nr:bis(5'-nucleosyl)-tetraphosphatase (symmetrical) YqeK [Mycoplasmataceae bacterium]